LEIINVSYRSWGGQIHQILPAHSSTFNVNRKKSILKKMNYC
jgi:hypothetical protein